MATTKRTLAPAADETPAAAESAATVQLRCEDLGVTRDFTPAHAKALLAFQESRNLTGDSSWQPVAADATPDSSNN